MLELTIAFEETGTGSGPATPTGISAIPLDESHVSITWRRVEGADQYNILRGTDQQTLLPYVTSIVPAFLDEQVISGTGYWYAIETVDFEKTPTTSARSEIIFALPGARPFLQKAVMETRKSVRLNFSKAMDESVKKASNYIFNRGIGRPTSAAMDASGSQVLLTLAADFREEGLYSVSCFNLADIHHTPLDTTRNNTEFNVKFAPTVPYLVDGRLIDNNSLELIFSESMQEQSINNTLNYDLGEDITVTSADFASGSRERVLLNLDTKRVFGALGKSYFIKVKNVKSEQGILRSQAAKNVFLESWQL